MLVSRQGTALFLVLLLFASNWSIARAKDDYDENSGGDYDENDDKPDYYEDYPDEDTGDTEYSPPSSSSGSRSGTSPSRSSSPSSSSSSSSSTSSDGGDGATSVWKYVIIGGIVVAAVAAAVAAWFCCCRRACRSEPQHDIETGMGKPYQQSAFITSTTPSSQTPVQAAPAAAGGDVWWSVAMKRFGSNSSPKGETWYLTADSKVTKRAEDIEDWVRGILGSHRWSGMLTYNDQPFGYPSNSSCGHCKGVVVWNDAHVGWLIHSLPRWPDPKSVDLAAGTWAFPEVEIEQRVKGQSFAWIIMPRARLPEVLTRVHFMQAYVDHCSPEHMWPHGFRKVYTSADTSSHVMEMQLGHGITHVAKHPDFDDDIYHEYLAKHPRLGGQQKWFVQTHHRSSTDPNEMPGHRRALIIDIQRVLFPDGKDCSRVSDHSKWAFATRTRHVFVGDLNRAVTQYKRGGGGVIIHSEHLHAFMRVRSADPPAMHEQ